MRKQMLFPALIILAGLALYSCASGTPATKEAGQPMTLELSSPAFDAGQPVPTQYTCDGEDISPPLEWSEVPQESRSLALICDDPDARGWVHWLLYNLPPTSRSLGARIPSGAELGDGSRQGKNSWGRVEYGGPCPPSGRHRYSFRLYALDTMLELPAGADASSLRLAMEGHILAQAELIGVYARQ
jgi:Raf kinase inhibitor-like YbhB/YbcL family protein